MTASLFEFLSLILAAAIVVALGLYPKTPKLALIILVVGALGLIVGANLVDENPWPWLSNIGVNLRAMFELHGSKLLRIVATIVLLLCCWYVAGTFVTPPQPVAKSRDNRRYFNR